MGILFTEFSCVVESQCRRQRRIPLCVSLHPGTRTRQVALLLLLLLFFSLNFSLFIFNIFFIVISPSFFVSFLRGEIERGAIHRFDPFQILTLVFLNFLLLLLLLGLLLF